MQGPASEGGDGRLALRRGSVVSQAPEDFTKNFMCFYIAYKDSFEKGENICEVGINWVEEDGAEGPLAMS